MSRVGKYPVELPQGVEASLADGHFIAKGKLGELRVALLDYVDVVIDGRRVICTPNNATKRGRQNWGTMRALISNAVEGTQKGFSKRLELSGVGYRAALEGKNLKLALGLSHDVLHPIPDDVKVVVEGDRNNALVVSGISKQRVGQVASDIKKYRRPEPYGGKGIRYSGEYILRKEGKKKK